VRRIPYIDVESVGESFFGGELSVQDLCSRRTCRFGVSMMDDMVATTGV